MTTHNAMIRPAWTPVTIAMMIIGFMIFWPLGLAMLAYILWGDRLDEFKTNVNGATDRFSKSWGRNCSNGYHQRTGNYAFDDWRKAELERLEEQRRKLDEARAEFDDYLRELRKAKDQEEFDSFMKARGDKGTPKGRPPKTVPDS